MFKTYIGINEFVDDERSLCFFFGVTPPSSLARVRKLYFPVINEAVVSAIKEFSPDMLKNGVSVIINPATYEDQKYFIDAAQRFLAYLYAKFIVFPSASHTIPDNFNVRQGQSSFSILREWSNAQNLPLHLKYPLCDVLKCLNLNIPVLILLPGPSLSEMRPHLKELRKKCIVVCIARSLSFCLEHDCPPDFVVHLDTDIKMKHLFPDGEFKESFLVPLSAANISEVSKQFAGVFFMESFAPSITKNYYRLRESWLSCSIACLGMAEALGATKVFIAGGDHSWAGHSDKDFHYLDENVGEQLHFNGPLKVENEYPCPNYKWVEGKSKFDTFEVPDAADRKAYTFFHYFATAEELNLIALEYREKGISCAKLQSTSILSNEAFPVVDKKKVLQEPDIDRGDLFCKLKMVDVQNCELDYKVIEDLYYDLLRQVEQNSAFLSLKLNQHDLRMMSRNEEVSFEILPDTVVPSEDILSHPYVKSITQSSADYKFQEGLVGWRALSFAAKTGQAWAKSLEKSLAYIRFKNCVDAGRVVRFYYQDEAFEQDLLMLRKKFSKSKIESKRIVIDGVLSGPIKSSEEANYSAVFSAPHWCFCVYSDLTARKFKYILDVTLRTNYLTMSEVRYMYG